MAPDNVNVNAWLFPPDLHGYMMWRDRTLLWFTMYYFYFYSPRPSSCAHQYIRASQVAAGTVYLVDSFRLHSDPLYFTILFSIGLVPRVCVVIFFSKKISDRARGGTFRGCHRCFFFFSRGPHAFWYFSADPCTWCVRVFGRQSPAHMLNHSGRTKRF